MLNSSFSLLRHKPREVILLTLIALGVGASPAWADVITDWEAKISLNRAASTDTDTIGAETRHSDRTFLQRRRPT
jgi:hypothetical protein